MYLGKIKFKNTLMLFVCAFFWGFGFAVQSSAMDYVGPFTFNTLRFLLGFIVTYLICLHIDKASLSRKERLNELDGGFKCGIIYFFAVSVLQFGVKYTSVGKCSFISILYIVLIPLYYCIKFKKLNIIIFISVIVAVVGFYFLCIEETFSLEIGDLIVLISAIIFTVHIIIISKYTNKYNPIRLTSYQFLITTFLSSICMFIFEKPTVSNILATKHTILFSGLLPCALANTLQFYGQKDYDTSVACLILSFEGVFGALGGFVLLGDSLTEIEIFGCILIFIAILIPQINEIYIKILGNKKKT